MIAEFVLLFLTFPPNKKRFVLEVQESVQLPLPGNNCTMNYNLSFAFRWTI